MSNCLNCGEKLVGNYCFNCGQKAIIKRYSLKFLFSDIYRSMIDDFDSKFLRTFKSLLIKPGMFIRSYLLGSRRNYISPFKYLFLVLAINFAVTFIINKPALAPVIISNDGNDPFIDQLIIYITGLAALVISVYITRLLIVGF